MLFLLPPTAGVLLRESKKRRNIEIEILRGLKEKGFWSKGKEWWSHEDLTGRQ